MDSSFCFDTINMGLAIEHTCADPEVPDPLGSRGSGPPLENHKLYIGFYRNKRLDPTIWKKLDPQEPWKISLMIVFFEIAIRPLLQNK